MKKMILLVLCLILVGGTVPFGAAALSNHIVRYKIEARLDVEAKTVEGALTLNWLNTSDTPVSDLHFHLYLNAFKNNRSTFMKESGGSHRKFTAKDDPWGYIDISKIALADGENLTSAMAFIQPDDGNTDDQTVMRVPLPESGPARGNNHPGDGFYLKAAQGFRQVGLCRKLLHGGPVVPKDRCF